MLWKIRNIKFWTVKPFLPELGLINLLFHKTLSHLLAASQIEFGMRILINDSVKQYSSFLNNITKEISDHNLSINKIQWNWNTPIKIFVIDAGLIKLFFHKNLSHLFPPHEIKFQTRILVSDSEEQLYIFLNNITIFQTTNTF